MNLSFFEENVGNTEDKRSEDSVILGNDIDDDDEDECTNEESEFRDRSNYLFEVITPGTFVVMQCPENSIELFFVGEVLTKGVASQDMEDENGHCVLEGEIYLEVNYLEKD